MAEPNGGSNGGVSGGQNGGQGTYRLKREWGGWHSDKYTPEQLGYDSMTGESMYADGGQRNIYDPYMQYALNSSEGQSFNDYYGVTPGAGPKPYENFGVDPATGGTSADHWNTDPGFAAHRNVAQIEHALGRPDDALRAHYQDTYGQEYQGIPTDRNSPEYHSAFPEDSPRARRPQTLPDSDRLVNAHGTYEDYANTRLNPVQHKPVQNFRESPLWANRRRGAGFTVQEVQSLMPWKAM